MSTSHPSSRKIYLPGSGPDLRVPMREVCLHGGEPPVRLYDTGGPWTDPHAPPHIKMGLTALRLPWIVGRSDVEELPGPASAYPPQRDEEPPPGGGRVRSVRGPPRRQPRRRGTPM